MTISNLNSTRLGEQLTYTWDMTLDYAFILINGKLSVSVDKLVTTATFPIVNGAYIEFLDSDDQDFDAEAVAMEYPRLKAVLTWASHTDNDISGYIIFIDGNEVDQVAHDGRPFYEYRSAKLTDSILASGGLSDHTADVKPVDIVGNIGDSSQLRFNMLNAAPPTQGLTVSQTVLGKINLDHVRPAGW